MSELPTTATLQARLHSSSPSSNNNVDTPQTRLTSSPRPSRPSSTVKPSTAVGGWGDTFSTAFGYGTTGGAGAGRGVKGKGRGGLPLWDSHGELGGSETEDGRRRMSGTSDSLDPPVDGGERSRQYEGEDELDELAESILWQAGTDHGDPPGPLLVIACSRIPPPTSVSHPDLLAKLRYRLEAFAASGPYSIILLANPTPRAPATANLVSAYLSLTRMSRKNLRRLWVVGGGWWTRVILTVFSSTLLSAKTAKKRKIAQASHLSALAAELGAEVFVQVDFPLEVYTANAVVDPEIKLPLSNPPLQRTFGVPLEELTGKDGDRLPAIVRDCVDVLLSQGPESVGIFRRSPSAAHVKLLEGAYDRGHPVSLSTLPDAPYLAASLLKLFLRSLPSPIFPPSIYSTSRNCPTMDDAALPYIRSRILTTLAPPALLLLQQLCAVLSAIAADSSTNLMTSENLVICLCPGLIGGLGASKEEIEMCRVPGMSMGSMKGMRKVNESGKNTLGGVLRVMIDHYAELFDPSTLSSLTPSLRLPLVGNEIDLTSPTSALRLASPRGSFSSSSASVHSAPRSPILSIREEDGDDTDSTLAQLSTSSSPPQSRSHNQAATLSPRRESFSSVSEKMGRSTSLSSLSSTTSSIASTFATSTSSGTLRLQKKRGSNGSVSGFVLESFGGGGAGGAGIASTGGSDAVSVGRSGTVRKSRGVVTVQGVEGIFVKTAGEEAEAEGEAEE